jgi:ribonuclease HI
MAGLRLRQQALHAELAELNQSRLVQRLLAFIARFWKAKVAATEREELRPDPCGAQTLSNNSAELSGVAQALLWLRAEGGTDTAHIFYDSDYAAGVARGRYRSNQNVKLAKLVQRLAREENARRSQGKGLNGIIWTHVKGHAGHPGNEWADFLADLGRTLPFYHSGTYYQRAYPYELDEYEETQTATDRHLALPYLTNAIAQSATPAGDKLRVPRDWVIFGSYAKWRKRVEPTRNTARVLDLPADAAGSAEP